MKIEHDLMAQLPKREWIDFSHRMIPHGRQICVARKPKCDVCPLDEFARESESTAVPDIAVLIFTDSNLGEPLATLPPTIVEHAKAHDP